MLRRLWRTLFVLPIMLCCLAALASAASALTVTITFPGTGSGTVDVYDDVQLYVQTCDSADGTCEVEVDPDSETVMLYSYPDEGSEVTATSANCMGGTSLCTVDTSDGNDADASITFDTVDETQTGTLNVTVDDDGDDDVNGTVTSDDEEQQINCRKDGGEGCSGEYGSGEFVTLFAEADEGSAFDHWEDADGNDPCVTFAARAARVDDQDFCSVAVSDVTDITAFFVSAEEPADNTLDVFVDNGGNEDVDGRVTSNDDNIDCTTEDEDSCSYDYTDPTEVTLTAEAAEGSQFDGWDADCENEDADETATCTVVVDGLTEVDAFFSPDGGDEGFSTLDVTVDNGGDDDVDGAVVDEGFGEGQIFCTSDGGACSAEYQTGTEVTLYAFEGEGSQFDGWDYDCLDDDGGDGEELPRAEGDLYVCTVLVDDDLEVTAFFSRAGGFDLSVSSSTGGYVQSDDENIDCGAPNDRNHADCDASYDDGDVVELTAIAKNGYTFVGFTGCDEEGDDDGGLRRATVSTSCTVTMNDDRDVSARFRQTSGGGGSSPQPVADSGTPAGAGGAGGQSGELMSPPQSTPPPVGPTAEFVTFKGGRFVVITCGTLACVGTPTAVLTYRGKTIGTLNSTPDDLTGAAGQVSQLQLKLTKKQRKALRRARRNRPGKKPKLTITVSFTLSDGSTSVVSVPAKY